MSQFKTPSSKGVTRIIAFVMAFAMVVTSITFVPAASDAAKKKVTKVSITKPDSKVLVLKKGKSYKLKTKVTASKKKYQKVTYKSSKAKIISVSKSGKLKAKKKGTAKITVTSKTDKKKKAVLTVKVGTPITGVKLTGTRGYKEFYYTEVVNQDPTSTNYGKKTTVRRSRTITQKKFTKKKSASVSLELGEFLTLKPSFAPSKATYKKVKYSSSNKKIVRVNSLGNVTTVKAGKATVTAKAADGSGKKATVKITVTQFVDRSTPAPTAEPETRKKTMVENFESYEIGTKWKLTTGGYANAATATVEKDPTNANNKVLKIAYTGTDQAYDIAPVFTIDLSKLAGYDASSTLGDFSGITFKTKVESNMADCQNKKIFAYFADAGTITDKYFFATEFSQEGELYKFKNTYSMALGTDKEYTDAVSGKKDNMKNFPAFFDNYATDKTNCSPGYVQAQNDATVPFVDRTLEFQVAQLKDKVSNKDLTTLNSFDFVFGSTYSGKPGSGDYMTLYIDDLQLLSDIKETPITGITLSGRNTVKEGFPLRLKAALVPENTTQKKIKFESSDESIATVDETGKVTGVKPGKATITVTSLVNPSVKSSMEITVTEAVWATEDKVLDLSHIMPKQTDSTSDADKKTASETEATYVDGVGVKPTFTKINEAVVIDLGEEVDFTMYHSVTITGTTPAQLTVELYDKNFDKTVEDYYEKICQGAVYPFFEGSTERRYEDGAYAEEYDSNCMEETHRVSYNDWVKGESMLGDLSAIRYVVLKVNKDPLHPQISFKKDENGKNTTDWAETPDITLKSIVLSTRQYDPDYKIVSLNEANEATCSKDSRDGETPTCKDVKYTDAGVTFTTNAARFSGLAFYLDSIKNADVTSGTAITTNQSHEVDVCDYRYVKLEVESNAPIAIAYLSDGNDWSNVSRKFVNEETDSDDSMGKKVRTIYIPIDKDAKTLQGFDFTKADAIGIMAVGDNQTVTVKSCQLVKGEPLLTKLPKEELDYTFVVGEIEPWLSEYIDKLRREKQ